MCPFQRRCRHRENGKAGSPADLTCWVINLQTNCLCLYIYIVTEYSRGNTAWNNCLAKWQLQLYYLYYSRQASVASLCFFSDNIKYWVNQLSTFGVVTLTGFSTTNSWKIIQNWNHEHNLAFAQLLPAPARQFKQQNPIIWQFNLITSDIWKDYANLRLHDPWGKEISNRNTLQSDIPSPACLPKDKVIWAKQLAKWTSTNTVHGACKGIKLDSSKHGAKSEVRGLSSLKPVFGKNQYMLFNIMLYTWYDMWYLFWTTIV